MTFNFTITGTNVVSESFANNPVFTDGQSYAGILTGTYSNVRAPTAGELALIQGTMTNLQNSNFFVSSDFSAGTNYQVRVYIFDGAVPSSNSVTALAHNSTDNASNGGAPANTIWIGWNSNALPGTRPVNETDYVLAHEIMHSSDYIDVRSDAIVGGLPSTSIQAWATQMGVSVAEMTNALKSAAEHKLIGERTEASFPGKAGFFGVGGTPGLEEGASELYIYSSLVFLRGLSSLSETAFEAAARALAANLDVLLPDSCFLAQTPVLLADGSACAIETIRPGDMVMAYDAAGALTPARVSRVMQTDVRHILDVFGLMVTPGHVTLCGDGRYAGRHVPILDILRTDGALVRADGTRVRAATGADLGSQDDDFVWVVTGAQERGGFCVRDARQVRRGTRILTATGHDITLGETVQPPGVMRQAERAARARMAK